MSGQDKADRFDRGIDMLQRGGDFAHVPLLQAAKDGLINVLFVTDRSGAIPFGKIRRSTRPVLLLIGDDDARSTGPDAWRFARQITEWAVGGIVHGAAAEVRHYEMAVNGALACRRFLVVDTASRHVPAWLKLLQHAQTLAILPRDGLHPVRQQNLVH